MITSSPGSRIVFGTDVQRPASATGHQRSDRPSATPGSSSSSAATAARVSDIRRSACPPYFHRDLSGNKLTQPCLDGLRGSMFGFLRLKSKTFSHLRLLQTSPFLEHLPDEGRLCDKSINLLRLMTINGKPLYYQFHDSYPPAFNGAAWILRSALSRQALPAIKEKCAEISAGRPVLRQWTGPFLIRIIRPPVRSTCQEHDDAFTFSRISSLISRH